MRRYTRIDGVDHIVEHKVVDYYGCDGCEELVFLGGVLVGALIGVILTTGIILW